MNKQARYRERMKERGLVQAVEWIPADRREEMRRLARQWRGEAPESVPAPSPAAPVPSPSPISMADARAVLGLQAGYTRAELERSYAAVTAAYRRLTGGGA